MPLRQKKPWLHGCSVSPILTDTAFAVSPVLCVCAAWEREFGHHRPTLLWRKHICEMSLEKDRNNIQCSGFPQKPACANRIRCTLRGPASRVRCEEASTFCFSEAHHHLGSMSPLRPPNCEKSKLYGEASKMRCHVESERPRSPKALATWENHLRSGFSSPPPSVAAHGSQRNHPAEPFPTSWPLRSWAR